MNCVLIYLGYPKQDWQVAMKAMADIKFLEKLKLYDKDNIPPQILNKVK